MLKLTQAWPWVQSLALNFSTDGQTLITQLWQGPNYFCFLFPKSAYSFSQSPESFLSSQIWLSLGINQMPLGSCVKQL